MIKRFVMMFLFTCACLKTQAQVNYVLNPSFEQYSHCPTGADQIRYANYWSQIDTNIVDPMCSPEYCNTCASLSSGVNVPFGEGYYHYPRTGNGMAQALMYFDESFPGEPYERDYVQGRFNKSLLAGKSYCVTFFVTLEQVSEYAINNIGAYLDNGSIDVGQDSIGCAQPQTTYAPQIIAPSIINDTLHWVMIQGSYIANGSEKFITIGNFFDKAHTSASAVSYSSSDFSYYLVDDVSVIASDAVADAGRNTAIMQGDSVYIGTTDEGMPCTWYMAGSSAPIGYSGGIWVKPDSTTKYIEEMNLCGNITYDAVTVTVNILGVKPLYAKGAISVYPNPAHDVLNIKNAENNELKIYNVLGEEIYKQVLSSNNATTNIANFPSGVYMVMVSDSMGNRDIVKVTKE